MTDPVPAAADRLNPELSEVAAREVSASRATAIAEPEGRSGHGAWSASDLQFLRTSLVIAAVLLAANGLREGAGSVRSVVKQPTDQAASRSVVESAEAERTQPLPTAPARRAAAVLGSEHSPEQSSGYRLDINTASADAWEQLPGIGPTLAQRIVADRQEHGAFTSIDDLARVRGIGPKTVAKLRAQLRVSP